MAKSADLKMDFQKLIKNSALAHGYILFGHESEKERLAFTRELANFFENQGRILSDALFLDTDDGDGGIDMVRAASRFLWQRPAVSPRRMLVINKADDLTLPAQNAILKIAEEPPAHALIILLLKTPEVLLPALRSRFQQIFIARNMESGILDTSGAKNFLKAPAAKRKELLKSLLEEVKEAESDRQLEDLITGLIAELRREPIKNYRILKELLARWSLIRQFNVNKKLQLEVVLQKL